MTKCRFCEREWKNLRARSQHERSCKNNPSSKDPGMTGKKGRNQYTKAKEEGRNITISDETRKKMSESARIKTTEKWKDPNYRKKHAMGMKKAVANNPSSYSSNNVSGRVKNIEYNGKTLKGSWELETAKYLDKIGMKWTNELEPFPYEWNGKWHLYFPDFYLEEFDTYIEVKGYKRDRDECKWKVVTKLIVIMQNEIDEIKTNTYDIYKHLSELNK